MATWGYLFTWDEGAAFKPGPREELLSALLLRAPDDVELKATLAQWDDDELIRCLFAEVARPADAQGDITLGKFAALPLLRSVVARRYGKDGPAKALHGLEAFNTTKGELELIPVPRRRWVELWRQLQAADPSLVALDLEATRRQQEQHASHTDGFTLATLGFIGWVLEKTPHSLAVVFEGLPTLPRTPPAPLSHAVIKDELLQAGLPAWDFVDDQARLAWATHLDPQTWRIHVTASAQGEVTHVTWQRPSGWQRFWGNAEWRSLGGVAGGCGCVPCRAAVLAASRLISPAP